MVLLLMMIMGTLMTTVSSNWLMMWLGLEINALALSPLMAKADSPVAKETATKYLIFQATTAIIMLLGILMLPETINQSNPKNFTHNIALILVMMALATKLGLAPMHTWLLKVIQGQSLLMITILVTWQKLAPLWIFIQLAPSYPTLTMILAASSFLSGLLGALKRKHFEDTISHSSITHLGWMLLMLPYSPYLAHLTFLVYFIMILCLWKNLPHSKYPPPTKQAKKPIRTILPYTVLLFLSILPLLKGFITMSMIKQNMQEVGAITMTSFTAVSAFLSLYYFIRLSRIMDFFHNASNPPNPLFRWLPYIGVNQPRALFMMVLMLSLPLTLALF
uniref:NADH-ubiquinone oxidoreductase chain 2 n=1 Tax=Callopanchax sidibeorum TaxID=2565563 RepID=A0A518QNT8_9TELE|nr:NADH dehydrogenase subunit 2 [Callopanchax sidibeorum]